MDKTRDEHRNGLPVSGPIPNMQESSPLTLLENPRPSVVRAVTAYAGTGPALQKSERDQDGRGTGDNSRHRVMQQQVSPVPCYQVPQRQQQHQCQQHQLHHHHHHLPDYLDPQIPLQQQELHHHHQYFHQQRPMRHQAAALAESQTLGQSHANIDFQQRQQQQQPRSPIRHLQHRHCQSFRSLSPSCATHGLQPPAYALKEDYPLERAEGIPLPKFAALVCGHTNGGVLPSTSSSTPFQNSIKEVWSLLRLLCTDALPSQEAFMKLTSHQQSEIVAQHVLQRHALQQLPPKSEYVIFLTMSKTQKEAYLMDVQKLEDIKRTSKDQMEIFQSCGVALRSLLNLATLAPQGSNKLIFLAKLLHYLFAETTEKIVVVAYSTKVLDRVGQLCAQKRWPFRRLDGRTLQHTRQQRVLEFNNGHRGSSEKPGGEFAFLLSAKAGGCGLNLQGASRLVLLDGDFNPASDLQATSRVWRGAQRRPCHIYRLYTTGTVDERILQTQQSKQRLGSRIFTTRSDPDGAPPPSADHCATSSSFFEYSEGESSTMQQLAHRGTTS